MAKQKAGVYDKVLECAKEEFLSKGFLDASLRTIAQAAETSTGSIYTRFGDKEGLFRAIAEPVVDQFKAMFRRVQEDFHQLSEEEQRADMGQYTARHQEEMLDYIYDHLAEFKILVTNGGERYDEFMHRVVELNSATTYRYIEAVGSDAVTAGRLTPELMHMISSACFSGIFEAVAHDMGRDEAKAYVERLCLFFRAGWQAIFDPQFAALVDLAAQMPDAPVQDVAARLVEARGGAP